MIILLFQEKMLAVGIHQTEREKVTDTMETSQEQGTVTHARIGEKPATTIASSDPNISCQYLSK